MRKLSKRCAGLNQLLWYYADMEKKKCNTATVPVNGTMPDPDACVVWRRFAKLACFISLIYLLYLYISL